MLAVITLLIVVMLSLLVTRVATIALTLTGMSREVARFQARSALTGSGFTTSESESVVNHPVRRRIVFGLMLLGSAGIVTVIATLLLSFTGARGTVDSLRRAGILLGGLVALLVAARSRWADRWLTRAIERVLLRLVRLPVRDYASLLRLAGEWMVAEMHIQEGDWVSERTLADVDLPDEGVLVLGIQRADGRYVGAPKGTATIRPGDVLVLYGPREALDSLDTRPRGRRGDRERRARAREYLRELERQERDEAGG